MAYEKLAVQDKAILEGILAEKKTSTSKYRIDCI